MDNTMTQIDSPACTTVQVSNSDASKLARQYSSKAGRIDLAFGEAVKEGYLTEFSHNAVSYSLVVEIGEQEDMLVDLLMACQVRPMSINGSHADAGAVVASVSNTNEKKEAEMANKQQVQVTEEVQAEEAKAIMAEAIAETVQEIVEEDGYASDDEADLEHDAYMDEQAVAAEAAQAEVMANFSLDALLADLGNLEATLAEGRACQRKILVQEAEASLTLALKVRDEAIATVKETVAAVREEGRKALVAIVDMKKALGLRSQQFIIASQKLAASKTEVATMLASTAVPQSVKDRLATLSTGLPMQEVALQQAMAALDNEFDALEAAHAAKVAEIEAAIAEATQVGGLKVQAATQAVTEAQRKLAEVRGPQTPPPASKGASKKASTNPSGGVTHHVQPPVSRPSASTALEGKVMESFLTPIRGAKDEESLSSEYRKALEGVKGVFHTSTMPSIREALLHAMETRRGELANNRRKAQEQDHNHKEEARKALDTIHAQEAMAKVGQEMVTGTPAINQGSRVNKALANRKAILGA